MSETMSVEAVAEAMFEMVQANHGKRNLKPMDITKAMIEKFGPERCDKDLCKKAIRSLIDPGRCIYSYFGGSYITLPQEDSAPA
jgi:hypothetical protein